MKSIITQYRKNVRAIIKNITGTSNEDLEQEVYLKTWKNKEKYEEQGKFRQWINTITSNICRDYLRKNNNRKDQTSLTEEITENLPSLKDNVEDIFESKLRRTKTAEAILSLPKKLQEVIVMYEIEGMDYQEISDIINVPLGTVKSRLYKARQELYKKLSDIV